MPRHTYFATCAPGLEPALHQELRELRAGRPERQVGGVRFEGDLAMAWRANLWLRTAVRVLLRLDRFACADADQLYEGIGAIDWSRYLRPAGTLAVQAQVRDSSLTHSQFVAQRAKDAVVDQLRARHGVRPSVDREAPDLQLHVHLYRDRATVSVDTSGDSLHLRGWRLHQGRAPLAETLAAGAVLLSDWDRRAPLLDPFCGSGTMIIEAALLAARIAPGSWRTFGFERWPDHDAAAWQRMRTEALDQRTPPRKLRLMGSDLDPERVRECRENAASAGCAEWVEFEQADARSFAPRPGWNAWVVSNLPYGERVGELRQLRPLLEIFGAALRRHCAGYHYALLSGNDELWQRLGLRGGKKIPLLNGGLEIDLWCGQIEG